MLAADVPRTPGSGGRSRFSKMLPLPPPPPPPPTTRPPSKALPPVPLVLPTQSFARKPIRTAVVAEKTLAEEEILSPPQTPAKSTPPPTLPPSAPLPELPSFLPPLPFETPLPPGPPPMSIPRRPVAPPKEMPAAPRPLPKLQATQYPVKPVVVGGAEAGRLSPADSIGSLLSAYSRSSAGDSIVQSSSDGFASQRNSESTISPEGHEDVLKSWKSGKDSFAPLPTIPQDTRLPQAREAPEQFLATGLKDLPHPPPPPRSAFRDEPPPTPRKDSIYFGKAESPVNNSTTASPPREQIWRRRSLKTDRPIQLPDLQLATLSHGSTAASQPSSQSTLPSAPTTLGASTQNSQPSQTAPTASGARAWQPQNKAYISPVEEKLSPEPSSSSGSVTSPAQQQFKAYTPPMEQTRSFNQATTAAATTSTTSQNVAPTHTQNRFFEDTMGAKSSKIRTQLSELSLAKSSREQAETNTAPTAQDAAAVSPLEAPRLPTPDYDRQDVQPSMADAVVSPLSPTAPPTPPHDETKPALQPIQRKAVGVGMPPAAAAPRVRPAQSLPQLSVKPSPRTSAEALPSPLVPPSARDFAPLTPGFAPRPGSRASSRPGSPASFAPRRGPGPGPRPGGPPYRPVITDFRELRVEDLPPPDPRALYFPKTVVSPAAPGTVFRPFPLGPSHMNCYTEHRIMKPSRNACYPLACQTCGVADRSERWACSACHLRVCSACNRLLGPSGRSVAKLLETLEAQEEQPPKGLGLTGT